METMSHVYLMPIIILLRAILPSLVSVDMDQLKQHYFPWNNLSAAHTLNPKAQIQSQSFTQKKPNAKSPPIITARSVYIFNPQTNQELLSHNPDMILAPASTTKIMTAIIALEEYNVDEVAVVSFQSQAIGQTTELVNGEQLKIIDLLYALLIHSGNDAAYALAQHHPSGYNHFINLMNQKALDLGLRNTHFANVSGIESPGHYSSAKDLAIISQYGLGKPLFRQIVATKSKTITDQRGWYSHHMVNLNQLLGKVEGVYGIKTGWTPTAGECLVSYVKRDDKELIVVVLGSLNRFAESEAIIEWAFANHEWVTASQMFNSYFPQKSLAQWL